VKNVQNYFFYQQPYFVRAGHNCIIKLIALISNELNLLFLLSISLYLLEIETSYI